MLLPFNVTVPALISTSSPQRVDPVCNVIVPPVAEPSCLKITSLPPSTLDSVALIEPPVILNLFFALIFDFVAETVPFSIHTSSVTSIPLLHSVKLTDALFDGSLFVFI